MPQTQLKLRLTKHQERTLNHWLWNLTGVWNWAIRKIELDAKDKRPKKRTRNSIVQIPSVTWDKTLDLSRESEPLWRTPSKHHIWLWPVAGVFMVLAAFFGTQLLLWPALACILAGIYLIVEEMP